MPRKMPKYKRAQKYPTLRSIPLRNPTVVRWPVDVGRPRPVSGPTEECFDSDAIWHEIKGNAFVRVTGEPRAQPKCVVLERRKDEMELRMYWLGDLYVFVQLYYCMNKIWISIPYRGGDNAKRHYRKGVLRWRESRPIAQGES